MHILIISSLLIFLFVAAWQDFHLYRIKNALVVSGALLGFFLNWVLPTGAGLTESLAGCVVGLLLLLPFYLLRLIAAGDVKLMAMVGAFLGPQVMIDVLLYVLVAGGLLAVTMAWYRGTLVRLFRNLISTSFKSSSSEKLTHISSSKLGSLKAMDKLPYGVAIMAGTLCFIVIHQ